jgi:hypothetical protein
MSESRRAAGHATNPPPRASWWHERRGLLASGTPLAFPVSQWRSEWRAWPVRARCPLQWRGRAGLAPASEYPRSCVFSCCSAAASLRATASRRKGRLELSLQASAFSLVLIPFLGGRFRLASQVARIERGEGVKELA